MASTDGEVLFRRIISDLWEFEIKEVSVLKCSVIGSRLILGRKQTFAYVGVPCIADVQHAHWFTLDFKRLDLLNAFRTDYNDGLDLAEAHRMRQDLRVDMVADVVVAAHSRKVRPSPDLTTPLLILSP